MTGDYQPGALAKALAAQRDPVPYPPVIAETANAQLMAEALDPILLEPDWSIVQTTVTPVFGRTYIADGKHEPTWRERVFGRRRRD